MYETVKQLKIQLKTGKRDSHIQLMLSNIETKEVVQRIKRTFGKMKVRVYISTITPPPKKKTNKKNQ